MHVHAFCCREKRVSTLAKELVCEENYSIQATFYAVKSAKVLFNRVR